MAKKRDSMTMVSRKDGSSGQGILHSSVYKIIRAIASALAESKLLINFADNWFCFSREKVPPHIIRLLLSWMLDGTKYTTSY